MLSFLHYELFPNIGDNEKVVDRISLIFLGESGLLDLECDLIHTPNLKWLEKRGI